jgi:multiple sugar transport system ATP-binding protein
MDDAALHPDADSANVIRVTVNHRESVGSDVFLHFDLAVPAVVTDETRDLASGVDSTVVVGLEQQALDQRTPVVVRAAPQTLLRPGDQGGIVIDTNYLHFFDPATGQAILGEAQPDRGVSDARASAPGSGSTTAIPAGQPA